MARRDLDNKLLEAAKDNKIELCIDLVVVNLYVLAFQETIYISPPPAPPIYYTTTIKPDVTYADAVEKISISVGHLWFVPAQR